MTIELELKELIHTLLVFTGVTLILKNWRPPIPKSKQALISLFLGGLFGWFLDPSSRDSFITGLIGSQIAFWGRGYFKLIKITQEEIRETSKNVVFEPSKNTTSKEKD